MRLRLATPLALLALATPLAACGESEKDKYVDDYQPLNDRLLGVGGDLGAALRAADTQRDALRAERFGALAKRLMEVNADIAALETPAELKDEAKALNARVDEVIADLKAIEKAARENDDRNEAAAVVELDGASAAVNAAQNRLARATGADVGER